MPKGWDKTRARILRRDHHRCVKCGAPAREVDHIRERVEGGGQDDDNLESLCREHHLAKTQAFASAKGNRVQAEMRERRKRPVERHPGLL